MEVLELAGSTDEGIPLSDVVAGLGIPSSSAYRLLGEMRRVGMLEAINGRGRHRVTKRFKEILLAADRNADLMAQLEKPFSLLADDLHETIYIVQMRGRVISLVGYVKPTDVNGLHPGNAFPIHASAAGKILWSYQHDEKVSEELLRPHIKFQDNTHVEESEIREELKLVRARGYGVHDEEWDKGVFTMAVPVFAGRNIPTLALGVIADKERLFAHVSREELYGKLCALRNRTEEILGN